MSSGVRLRGGGEPFVRAELLVAAEAPGAGAAAAPRRCCITSLRGSEIPVSVPKQLTRGSTLARRGNLDMLRDTGLL